MQKATDQRLTAKNLVTVGIYSVLIRIILVVPALLFTPILTIVYPFVCGFGTLLSAPVYLLMAYKVGKRGVMFLFCTVAGLSYLLMGMVYMLPYLLITGVICEAVMRGKGTYRHFWRNTVGYCVFALLYMCSNYYPIYILGNDYINEMQTSFGADTVNMILKYSSSPIWIAVALVATTVMTLIGCLLGRKMLKKHFVKAGLISG